MTVIAYSSKHRIMAADSRCFDNDTDTHFTTMRKIFRLKTGAALGVAGDVDARDLIALLSKATPRKMPSRAQLAELRTEVDALLVFPKGQVFTVSSEHGETTKEWSGEVLPVLDTIVAVGSGAPYAYGAMEVGADPMKAVRAACRRDFFCALPVQWEKVV